MFGEANEGFGVLMAATIGVPLYVCGGGTIPLIRGWLAMGMSMGAPRLSYLVKQQRCFPIPEGFELRGALGV